MSNYNPAPSPWDAVNNPTEPTQTYYGAVTISAWEGMLVKGVPGGKLPYDPGRVNPDTGKPYGKVVIVDLAITPLAECNLAWDIKRQDLAFGSSDWGKTTWPSLRALGVTEAQSINDKFVKIEMTPTGRTYTASNGETKTATAIKFVALYPDRAACLKAWQDEFGGMASGNGHQPQAAAQEQPPANGNEREAALKFAKAFVASALRSAGGDLDKARETLTKTMAAQPLVSRYFTPDSPEIVEAMAAGL